MRKLKKTLGFTLIELMIVVAVIAILAAIAYPSYRDNIRKSRRVDAKSALTDIAQLQEAFYARNGRYTDDMTDLGFGNAGWNNVPLSSPNAERFYQARIRSEALPACPLTNCYRLRARPRSTTDQVNDIVEFYELHSDGTKRYRVGGTWSTGWKK